MGRLGQRVGMVRVDKVQGLTGLHWCIHVQRGLGPEVIYGADGLGSRRTYQTGAVHSMCDLVRPSGYVPTQEVMSGISWLELGRVIT